MNLSPKEIEIMKAAADALKGAEAKLKHGKEVMDAASKVLIAAEAKLLHDKEVMDAAANVMDGMREALLSIVSWSNAYPLSVFPEPDLKKARSLLEEGGISLDSISAHCMRHVVVGVGQIARKALGDA